MKKEYKIKEVCKALFEIGMLSAFYIMMLIGLMKGFSLTTEQALIMSAAFGMGCFAFAIRY